MSEPSQPFPALTNLLRDALEKSAVQSARKILWSLWTWTLNDACPRINLWRELSYLDSDARHEMGSLIVLSQDARERQLRALLETTGEWDRIDTHPITWA